MARDKVKIMLDSGYDSDKDNKENDYYLTADTQGSVTVTMESKTDDKQLWWKYGGDEDFVLESIGANPGRRFLISNPGLQIVLGPEGKPGEKLSMEKPAEPQEGDGSSSKKPQTQKQAKPQESDGFSRIIKKERDGIRESLVFHVGNDNIVVLSSKEQSTLLWKIVYPDEDAAKAPAWVP